MRRLGILFAALLSVAGAGCRRAATSAAKAIPADSTAAAAIDLTALRAAPAYRSLPQTLKALTEPLAGARELVVAWNGTELLLLVAGDSQSPGGYTPIGQGIAAAGPASRINAARQALIGGAASPVTPHASATAAEIRAVVRGDGNLPFPGNLSILGNLLRMTEVTRVTAHVENAVEVEVEAQCVSIGRASELEQSLRAMATLAAAGTRDAELAGLLGSLRIDRESLIVRIHGMAQPGAFQKLF